MENPNPTTLTDWQWVKVATNIDIGTLHRLESRIHYYQTFRITGDTAPTNPTIGILPEEAVKVFESGNLEKIESDDKIDVYIMSVNYINGKSYTGKIRVDI